MSERLSERDRLLAHYESEDLLQRILTAWKTAGGAPEVLSQVDEFHVRGPAATAMLIGQIWVGPQDRILDIGSGLGGPARALARSSGAEVVGLDLSAQYTAVATELSRQVGLSDRTRFLAEAVEDNDGIYDAAWTIHVGMNVADKEAFYHAVLKRLKPGAPFVIYDFVRGPSGEPTYPLPWADGPEESHLSALDSLEIDLRMAGFDVETITDDTPAAAAFMQAGLDRAAEAGAPPPLGLHLVLGHRFPQIAANVLQGLNSGALAVAMIRATRPE